jgi:hypothetical protein
MKSLALGIKELKEIKRQVAKEHFDGSSKTFTT